MRSIFLLLQCHRHKSHSTQFTASASMLLGHQSMAGPRMYLDNNLLLVMMQPILHPVYQQFVPDVSTEKHSTVSTQTCLLPPVFLLLADIPRLRILRAFAFCMSTTWLWAWMPNNKTCQIITCNYLLPAVAPVTSLQS